MRTTRSSSCPGEGLVLIPLNFPLGCWPGPDPPQFPPWGWAWIWPPSISPLAVGLDLIPLHFPLGCGPGSDPPQFPPWLWAWTWSPSISPLGVGLEGWSPWQRGIGLLGRRGVSSAGGDPSMHWGRPPSPVNRMTNRCKNITLPQTSFAGGKYVNHYYGISLHVLFFLKNTKQTVLIHVALVMVTGQTIGLRVGHIFSREQHYWWYLIVDIGKCCTSVSRVPPLW